MGLGHEVSHLSWNAVDGQPVVSFDKMYLTCRLTAEPQRATTANSAVAHRPGPPARPAGLAGRPSQEPGGEYSTPFWLATSSISSTDSSGVVLTSTRPLAETVKAAAVAALWSGTSQIT